MPDFQELKSLLDKVNGFVLNEKHEYVLPEHLLYVLLEEDRIKRVFKDLKLNDASIKRELKKFFKDVPLLPVGVNQPVPTSAYTKVFQRAIAAASSQSVEPDSRYLLLALFEGDDKSGAECETYAQYFLQKHGMTHEKIKEHITKKSAGEGEALSKYAIDLVDMAKAGKIDPLIGRQDEVNRVIQVLNKKRSNNALLVGMPGTGKTAIVEGLALKIANNEVPKSIQDFSIFAIDMAAMIAGTKFRGEFEERLQNVIKEASQNDHCFVFIDELHNVIGAGAGADGSLDAGNILKPYLSRGELRMIGATTYEEYKNKIVKDKAFCRRFKKIDLSEPSKEDTFKILQGIRSQYEEFHGIKFNDDVLQYAIDLSGRFIIDRSFPDKAIDVIDEIGSAYKAGLSKGKVASKEDVEFVIGKIANIPIQTASETDKDKLRTLGERIKNNLFGQDETVDDVVKKIKIAKAGFGNKNKPISLFLLGTTGGGKTEFAKQLASNLGIGFVKLDMSEYSEKYSVSKLIGAAPGYVGFEQSGALTEPLIRNPHCVLLLDEIEKADRSVFDLLLQVLDEGKLTDNQGREASFRNAIVIMTSNTGCSAAEQSSTSMGFVKSTERKNDDTASIIDKAMKSTFTPEFRNRIQGTYMFNPLNEESMRRIVRKNLRIINDDLQDKKVVIELTEDCEKYIAELAMEENMGGRPVERLLSKYVQMPLVDELLFGKLENGGKATVDIKDGAFAYEIKEIEAE